MEKAFKRIMTKTPKILKNRHEDKNSPKAFMEELGQSSYEKSFDVKTGAHFKYDYMVTRLAALARSIKDVFPNYNAVLHLTLDVLEEHHERERKNTPEHLDPADRFEDELKQLAAVNHQKMKKFLIDPVKLATKKKMTG